MKAYGVKRQDNWCCEGHNPYGKLDRRNSRLHRTNARRAAKKRARQSGKAETREFA
jgi:hypothetical protein